MTSIKLFRGEFGHVSVLNAASDLVTHAHPEAHIIIWLEGAAGEMLVGREIVRLGSRVAAGVNSLEPHSHSFAPGDKPGRFLAFYIDPEWAHRRRGHATGTAMFAKAAIALDPWLYQAATSVIDRLADDDVPCEIASYDIERLIDNLFDATDATRPGKHRMSNARGSQDFRVRRAIELMKANVCERICLDDVARRVGLSRPHFFALFKEQTNLTPNVYWNTLRMEEALRRMHSQESLASVACDLGFTTQGNFTRFFRDHAGVPPTLYREATRATA